MAILPDYPAFAQAYEGGRPQAVYTRLIADLETPVSAFLKLGEGRNRQVRRLGEHAGMPVMRLARVAHAGITPRIRPPSVFT